GTADRNRSHWSTSKTPSYTKSVSWQHHLDILSEEEVSYYKKSLISQEGSIKKGAPGDAPVVAKSALWGVITPCLLHC
ncbi:hypothetical protein, partial [Escherichia coli]|uniref:hypothetical protein n=1 Tax=Escherichia coli TaxID=562 RepID=UPI000EF79FB8